MGHNWHNSTRSATLPADWPKRRARVLRRDRDMCQIRYDGICTVKATQVDHKRDRLDHSMDNLQGACRECNAHKNYLTRGRPARVSAKRKPEPHPGLTTPGDIHKR